MEKTACRRSYCLHRLGQAGPIPWAQQVKHLTYRASDSSLTSVARSEMYAAHGQLQACAIRFDRELQLFVQVRNDDHKFVALL
jgi:hypothetical protein